MSSVEKDRYWMVARDKPGLSVSWSGGPARAMMTAERRGRARRTEKSSLLWEAHQSTVFSERVVGSGWRVEPASVAPSDAPTRGLSARTGHIHLSTFGHL